MDSATAQQAFQRIRAEGKSQVGLNSARALIRKSRRVRGARFQTLIAERAAWEATEGMQPCREMPIPAHSRPVEASEPQARVQGAESLLEAVAA